RPARTSCDLVRLHCEPEARAVGVIQRAFLGLVLATLLRLAVPPLLGLALTPLDLQLCFVALGGLPFRFCAAFGYPLRLQPALKLSSGLALAYPIGHRGGIELPFAALVARSGYERHTRVDQPVKCVPRQPVEPANLRLCRHVSPLCVNSQKFCG